MSYEEIAVLFVLAGGLALFVTQVVPMGVAGLCIMASLGLLNVLGPTDTLSAFTSPAVVLVGSLYVVSASLIRTGVVNFFETKVLRFGGNSETRLLIVSTVGVALASAVLNNTSVVVLMLPILLSAARKLDLPPSRLLMPVSFAAILGGTMTLIGTSTNVLVADMALRRGIEIGFFEFLPVGAGFAATGLFYMWTVGRRMLPSRPTVSSVTRGRAFEYVTELRVPEAGPAVGLRCSSLLDRSGDIRILQLVREEEVLGQECDLEPEDTIVLRGPPREIVALKRELKLDALPGAAEGDVARSQGTTFAEIVITPVSELLGRTLASVGLHRIFGVVAVALQRRGAHLRHGITHVPLHVGDTILVQGTPQNVEKLRGQPGLILLVGIDEQIVLHRRAPVALVILGLFITLAAIRWGDLALLALSAATLCLVTGCLSLRRAVLETDWNVLGLLAGAITLGLALTRSGLAGRAATLMVDLTRDLGPHAVLCAVYFLTAVGTELASNAGAAAIMVPIALATATQLDVSARPFVFAVAFGASASFSTPIGYQTNALIHGPGGYRFADFLRVGLPLQLLLWVYASLVIPIVFPF